MPADMRSALQKHGLLARYGAASSDKRMRYLRWIDEARGPMRDGRIDQMIAELKRDS